MLRVAIAEDNSKDRERLQSFLKQYETEKNTQIEIAEYTDGSKLLDRKFHHLKRQKKRSVW